MKKKIAIGTGIFAVIIALVVSLYSGNVSQADPKLSHEDVKSLISAQYPGTITELELDREGNNPYYEIEIVNEDHGTEYELKVDANTGEILKLKEKRIVPVETAKENDDADAKGSKRANNGDTSRNIADATKEDDGNYQTKIVEKEQKQIHKPQKQTNQDQKKQPAQKQAQQNAMKKEPAQKQEQTQKKEQKRERKHAIISRQQAINIALAEFPGKVESVKLDEDDGRLIYEIEIENGDREAEIEIDAITGKIIVMEIDA